VSALRLGRIDESFYQVVGGVVAGVLRRYGHDVAVFDGSHTEIYGALESGDVDLAVAYWLPYGHAAAWQRLGVAAVELAVLYEGAQFFWAMPAYANDRFLSIGDLSEPEASQDVPREIRGLSLDATITTASQQAVVAYGLEPLGFRVAPGGFDAWESSLKEAVDMRRPVVLPLWRPYYLNAVFDLRVLADPQGVLGPANRVILAARRDARERIGDAAEQALRSIGLTLDTVSELDRRVHVDRRSPDYVAHDWLSTSA